MKKLIFGFLILVSIASAYAQQNEGGVSSGGGKSNQPDIKRLILTY